MKMDIEGIFIYLIFAFIAALLIRLLGDDIADIGLIFLLGGLEPGGISSI